MQPERAGGGALLRPGDPPPFEHKGGSSSGYFIVCDHASAAIPAALGTLGLPAEALATHIAIDIGARSVALALAERLGSPALLAGYSRLVIDCNRYPWDPASITRESDRTPIIGNRALSAQERAARIESLFLPYHRAIGAALDARIARGASPVFLSIHSCTPRLNEESRPWHIGLSYRPGDALAAPMLEALRRDPALAVGDNQPYLLEMAVDYTTPEHALRRGLPYLQVEFRQDLIASPADACAWADRFVEALSSLPHAGAAPPPWSAPWPPPHVAAHALDLLVAPAR